MIKGFKESSFSCVPYINRDQTCLNFTIRHHFITCIYIYTCIVFKFWQNVDLPSYALGMKGQDFFWACHRIQLNMKVFPKGYIQKHFKSMNLPLHPLPLDQLLLLNDESVTSSIFIRSSTSSPRQAVLELVSPTL